MTETRSFTEIMRPPEIDACKMEMRSVLRGLEAQGYDAGELALAITGRVMGEAAHEDSTEWSNKFYRIERAVGGGDDMAGRFPSGWSGRACRLESMRALQRRHYAGLMKPIGKKYPDSEYKADIEVPEREMRAAVFRLKSWGNKGRYVSLALLEVALETADDAGGTWPQAVRNVLRGSGEHGVTIGRYFSGWKGPESARSDAAH